MKRILALVLLCALLPVGLTALGEAAFTFDAKTGTITGYTGDGGVVQVPAAIDGVPVRVLGVGAFDQNSAITQVVLPEGLTHILSNAFYFCDNLETVQFPGTLQVVDSFAFLSCKQLTDLLL